MATTKRSQNLRRKLKTADKYFYELTGTHLRTVVARGIDIASAAIKASVVSQSAIEIVDDPDLESAYATLGIRKDAEDDTIKDAFRGFVRRLHPDTGINPDAKKFQKILEAYNVIMFARVQDEDSRQNTNQSNDTGGNSNHG